MRSLQVSWATLAALLLACAAAYWPGLDGPLLLDDYQHISPLLDQTDTPLKTLAGNHLASTSGPLGRPVAMASFLLNAVTSGGDLWQWKFTNLAIHLATGVLVFWLAQLLFNARRAETEPVVRAGALVIAAIWLLHPLQLSTVLYTVQRMAQLSALFTVAGLGCYTLGRIRQLQGSGNGRTPILLAYLLFFPLAVLSKENALLFPLYAFLIESLLFQFRGEGAISRLVVGVHTVFFGLLYTGAALYLVSHISGLVVDGYAYRDFSLGERVLTEFRVLAGYVFLLLVPRLGAMGFFHDDLAVSTGLFSPFSTSLSILFVLALLASAMLLRRRLPVFSLGVSLFLAAHLLESTVIPMDLMFEHRNYLASFGLVLAAVNLAGVVLARPAARNATAAVCILALGALTAARADIWSSEAKMYTFMFAIHPNSERLRVILANNYLETGRYDTARALLDDDQANWARLFALEIQCREEKRIPEGRLARTADGLQGILQSHDIKRILQVANAGLREQCEFSPREMIGLMDHALALKIYGGTNRQDLGTFKGVYLRKIGQLDTAVQALKTAHAAWPGNPAPLFLATDWLLQADRQADAIHLYQAANQIADNSTRDYSAYQEPLSQRMATRNHTDGFTRTIAGGNPLNR